MLSGENGILNQAADAKTKTEEKTTEEQVKLAAMETLTEVLGEWMKQNLKRTYQALLEV